MFGHNSGPRSGGGVTWLYHVISYRIDRLIVEEENPTLHTARENPQLIGGVFSIVLVLFAA
jgi:hypothetical protein